MTRAGTTVPLELDVVRFLHNSTAGYAVIFMHRQFSLQPFGRNYSHSTHPFLDFLDIDATLPSSSTIDSAHLCSNDPSPSTAQHYVTVRASECAALLSVLQAYKAVQAEGALHTLRLVTVNDYLDLLPKAMYHLAAAANDFFLPRQKMIGTTIHTFQRLGSLGGFGVGQSEHKIQSGKGSLHIEMDQVPEVLKPLVSEWVPAGSVVSFKLETDQALLIPKARQALERYGHQVVIGNDLHHQRHRVVLVSPKSTVSDGKLLPNGLEYEEMLIEIVSSPSAPHQEIEEGIVRELVVRHDAWIKHA